MMLLLSLLAFITWLNTTTANCGYVDVKGTVEFGTIPVNLGEFTFSTDRCEALHAILDVPGLGQYTVDGAMTFSCDPTNSSRVIVKEYNDLLCTGRVIQSSTFSINGKVNLFNDYLFFTLQRLSCSDTNCGIDITFSDDCRGIDSSKYSNLAFPVDSCQTFANDFGEGTFYFQFMSSVAYEILPQGTVDALFSTALQFKCCQNDNSLLIYNYSDTNCDINAPYNTLRLANTYNNTCFALGNAQKPFDMSTDKANADEIDIQGRYVYALKYTWYCDQYVDCNGIEFIDNNALPNLCPDKCLEPGYTFAPTISFAPTTAPSVAPTFHPISDEDNVNTVSPYNVRGNNSSNASQLILIGVIMLLIIVTLVVIAFCVYRKRKMKRIVEESEQNEIQKFDSKYEPMITNEDYQNKVEVAFPEGNIKTEIVKDNDTSGQYVLPSQATVKGEDVNDDANLLTKT